MAAEKFAALLKERVAMRAVIIGAGKIGYNIAQTLSQEGHDVIVIEQDEERKQVVEDNLDVQAMQWQDAVPDYWKALILRKLIYSLLLQKVMS